MQNKIEKKALSKEDMDDILDDLDKHLSTPSGTLENYSGKYGKSIIELIKKHYPELISDECIDHFINVKIRRIYDHIYENAMLDKRITIRSDMLKMLTNYILGEKEEQSSGPAWVFSMPFIEKGEGNRTSPLPRTIKENANEPKEL
jgi:hypothetical protein